MLSLRRLRQAAHRFLHFHQGHPSFSAAYRSSLFGRRESSMSLGSRRRLACSSPWAPAGTCSCSTSSSCSQWTGRLPPIHRELSEFQCRDHEAGPQAESGWMHCHQRLKLLLCSHIDLYYCQRYLSSTFASPAPPKFTRGLVAHLRGTDRALQH